MKNDEYSIACTEVLEVLNYIPKNDYDKIPRDVIDVLEKNKKDDVVFLYNPWISLNEQKMSEKGRLMIASFYKNYWATDEQKKKINAYQDAKRKEINLEKQKKHNNVFGNEKNHEEIKFEEKTLAEMLDYRESFFTKCINKILRFLHFKK